jgi:hypothetical protein
MGRKPAMALVSNLALAAAVFANAGPAPLPKDRKVAEPPVRFEGLDKHPDYVFCLHYHVLFRDSTLLEIKDDQAFKLHFKFTDRSPVVYMTLFAMERKEFEKRKKEDPSLKWLYEPSTKGVLQAKLNPPETTVPITVKDIPVTTYRVTLEDSKLSAEKVENKKCGEESTGLLPPWVFAMVSSLSIAWLGVWFARRDGARTFGRMTRES